MNSRAFAHSKFFRGTNTFRSCGSQLIRTIFVSPFRTCDWCEKHTFGQNGHGFRTAIVVEDTNGLSYEEQKDGHSDYAFPSRMCTLCTMSRMQLITCNHSSMEPINESEIFARNMEEDAMARSSCRVCTRAPTHFCNTTHEEPGTSSQGRSSSDARGCGLELCYICHKALGKVGNLQSLLKMVLDDPAKYGYASYLRADAELLNEDGLLMRNFIADMQPRM